MPLPQIQPFNFAQIDQAAQQGVHADTQNMLARLQMRQAQQEWDENQASRNAFINAKGDWDAAQNNLMGQGLAKQALALQKARQEADKAGLENKKLKVETALKNLDLIGVKLANVTTDEHALAMINELSGEDPRQAAAMTAAYQFQRQKGRQPNEIAQEFASSLNKEVLAKVKAYAPEINWEDLGGQKVATNKNPLAGPVGPVAGIDPMQKTATPDALVADKRAREEGKANREVSIRGQDKVDARAKEANQIAAGNKQQAGVVELRKEFNALPEVKNYKEVLPIIESVRSAPNTPAGDLDLIYGVGKVMDPNSVVREGEMNLVIKSGSPMQRFQGWVSYVQGGGRLSEGQRKELMNVMQSRVGGLEQNYQRARATYENAANQQGLPKDQIFIESPAQQPAQQPKPAAPKQAPVSFADGGAYVTANGQRFQVTARNPDGSIKIRDPKTGKTGTLRP